MRRLHGTKAFVFWGTAILLLFVIIVNFNAIVMKDAAESIPNFLGGIILLARTFYVDKFMRQYRNQETVDFGVFMMENSIIRLISLGVYLKPYLTKVSDTKAEKTRQVVNVLTYLTYIFISWAIVITLFDLFKN